MMKNNQPKSNARSGTLASLSTKSAGLKDEASAKPPAPMRLAGASVHLSATDTPKGVR